MSTFICAVHAEGAAPRAYALVEQTPGPAGAVYRVRRLRTLTGEDPRRALADALAAEPQFTAATTVVTTGGQRAADALHENGPSAVAVTLLAGQSGDADALDVTVQVLVDTFEGLYRAGAVEVPGALDEGSAAVTTLYRGADLEAAAPDGDRNADGDVEDAGAAGPSPSTVRQSGGQASVSTAEVSERRNAEMLGTAPDRERLGRIAGASGADAPDLGEHRDVALALALACWYGEHAADELPATDQADAILKKRLRRANGARA